jgi:arylsulfatase A-like enzyme
MRECVRNMCANPVRGVAFAFYVFLHLSRTERMRAHNPSTFRSSNRLHSSDLKGINMHFVARNQSTNRAAHNAIGIRGPSTCLAYGVAVVAIALSLVSCGGGGDSTAAVPVATNAAPTGTVAISGDARVGAVLSVTNTLADADGLGTLQYQWLRNATSIASANGSTYNVQQADLGAALSVIVSYVDGKGTSERVTSLATALVVAAQTGSVTQPNILLIIADDLGLDSSNQYSYSQDKPRTPNLDALAASGIVFDNLWATPSCTTTRGSLITGQHGVHSGISFVPATMNTSANTIQRYLRANAASASYQTAVIGKWHLGGANPSNSHPIDSGVGYYAGNITGVLPDYYNWPLIQNGLSTTSTTYHTTKVTDLARDWVTTQTQPWFLWLAYSAPHDPFHLPPTSLQSRTTLTGVTTDISARPREYYLAAIEAMDSEIGRLLGSMSAETRANTVVMFIGDNGSPTQTVDTNVFSRTRAKNTLYEGGIRVPMIVAGKGVTRSNARESALVNTVDFYATIAALAGNAVSKLNDGYSFASLLQASGAAARQYNYSEFQSDTVSGWTVRTAQYKLIQNLNGTQSLYDLSKDLSEQTDLLTTGADYSAIVSVLKAQGDTIRR